MLSAAREYRGTKEADYLVARSNCVGVSGVHEGEMACKV